MIPDRQFTRTLGDDQRLARLSNHCRPTKLKPAKFEDVVISELGLKVLRVLDMVYNGLHHCDDVLRRTTPEEWADSHFLQVTVYDEGWATWDSDMLSKLVILAHDLCLRVSISPANPRYLKIGFSLRKWDGEFISDGHPTLEDHAEMIRRRYPWELSTPTVEPAKKPTWFRAFVWLAFWASRRNTDKAE